MNLAAALPLLLRHAIAWAESQEADVLATGRSLAASEVALAKAVGVLDVSRVRLKIVNQLLSRIIRSFARRLVRRASWGRTCWA
jgi:hypothetical protein